MTNDRSNTATAALLFVLLQLFFHVASSLHLSTSGTRPLDRRQALARSFLIGAGGGVFFGVTSPSGIVLAADAAAEDGDDDEVTVVAHPSYERRDRRSNNDAVIREDYWYMTGRIPPRNLQEAQLTPDDPQWNAFGSCQTNAEGSSTNSCTYVPLRQRIPAYSKYGYNIALGAKEYQQLGNLLRQVQQQQQQKGNDSSNPSWWTSEALSYLEPLSSSSKSNISPAKDALLKMILLSSGLLTSPNFSGPNRELLVARFYVNEVRFAMAELVDALQKSDLSRALYAWEFGRDHWNSYFVIVNRQISPKVGDKFERIV